MRKHYEALDGLRGVAALAVVWLHINQAVAPLKDALPSAYLAVDFFFCLSGFVVAHAYERKLASGMGFLEFAAARLVRLMPLAMLGAVMGGATLALRSLTAHDFPLTNVVAATALNVFVLPSLPLTAHTASVFPADPPLWSLFWELVINAAFALAAPRLKTAWLLGVVGMGAALTVGLATIGRLDVGHDAHNLPLGVCRVLFPFTCGVLLHRLPELRNRLALVLAGLLALVLLAPIRAGFAHGADVILAFPALVWIGAGASVGFRLRALCVWMGQLSYPLYVLHFPVLRLVAYSAKGFAPADAPAISAMMMAASVAFSVAAMYLYDEPVRAWLKVRLERAKAAEAELAKAA